jgi:hypothetical protein
MHVYFAIALGIISSLCSNIGSNLQKYGFKNNYYINYWQNKYLKYKREYFKLKELLEIK